DLAVPGIRLSFQRPTEEEHGAVAVGKVRRFPAGDAEIAAADAGDDRVVVRIDHQGVAMQLLDFVGFHRSPPVPSQPEVNKAVVSGPRAEVSRSPPPRSPRSR